MRVGGAVSVGARVAVCMGKSMGVTVGYGEVVAEGDGLDVDVAVTVGDAGAKSPNPPHPRRNKTSADIPISVFRKCLQRMIQVPENPQTFERKPGRDDLDHVRFLSDDCRKPACRNHLHVVSQLPAEALDHALYHADITKQ